MFNIYRVAYRAGVVVFSALLLVIAPLSLAQDFRILVTNDDGINSPQLEALAMALASLPDTQVIISAPAENQSGSSHASSSEVIVEEVHKNGQPFGYAVQGRPADAVRWAVKVLGTETPFDLVVSGINRGANVGDVAHLSGTVGAAMEAQYHGIDSVAVSQDTVGVDTAFSASFAADLVQRLRETGFPAGVVVSVNIPRGEINGVRVRKMGESYLYYEGFEIVGAEGDGTVYRRERVARQATDPRTDTWAWQQGYITITPLKFDWTDYEVLGDLQTWDWELNGQPAD